MELRGHSDQKSLLYDSPASPCIILAIARKGPGEGAPSWVAVTAGLRGTRVPADAGVEPECTHQATLPSVLFGRLYFSKPLLIVGHKNPHASSEKQPHTRWRPGKLFFYMITWSVEAICLHEILGYKIMQNLILSGASDSRDPRLVLCCFREH